MLYIVELSTNKILFRVDAWCQDCMTQASNYMAINHRKCIKDEITFMGDRVLWVA